MVFFFLFIIVSLTGLFIWSNFTPMMNTTANGNVTNTFTASINQTVSFWDLSFSAIYIIVSLASIILTIFLQSNPALLVIWLLLNVVILFVWDQLNSILTLFLAMPLNGGQFPHAVAFFQGDIPKIIPIINMLIGLFLFGKNLSGGGTRSAF